MVCQQFVLTDLRYPSPSKTINWSVLNVLAKLTKLHYKGI